MRNLSERLEFWKDRLAESLDDLTFSVSEKVQDLAWAIEERLESLGEVWERVKERARVFAEGLSEHREAILVAGSVAALSAIAAQNVDGETVSLVVQGMEQYLERLGHNFVRGLEEAKEHVLVPYLEEAKRLPSLVEEIRESLSRAMEEVQARWENLKAILQGFREMGALEVLEGAKETLTQNLDKGAMEAFVERIESERSATPPLSKGGTSEIEPF